MKKLHLAAVFTLIVITMTNMPASGYETFEELVTNVENKETGYMSEMAQKESGDIRFSVKSAASSFSINNSQQEFTSTPNPGILATKQEIASHQTAYLRNQLIFTTDKIENITWVRAKTKNAVPYITIYSGEHNGTNWLRLSAKVRWPILLDIGQIVLNIDGELYRIPVDPQYRKISVIETEYGVSKSVVGYKDREARGIVKRIIGYTEKIDIPVSGSQQIMEALQQIPDSSNTAVRLRGYNGSVDFNMSSASKNALSMVLRYYEARRTELQ